MGRVAGYIALAITGLLMSGMAAETTRTSALGNTGPGGRMVQAHVTWYAAYDNNPPNSREIAFPRSAGFPTVHDLAGGTGTYDDPITAAADNRDVFPIGVRVYDPRMMKYFVVEDLCGTCVGEISIDLYAGHATEPGVIDCEHALTPDGPVPMEVDPPRGRTVDPRPIYEDGHCIELRAAA